MHLNFETLRVLLLFVCFVVFSLVGVFVVISNLGMSKAFRFDLQSQHDDLEAKFFEERAALEAKYQKLYQPLYTKVSRWSIRLFLYLWSACSVLNTLSTDLWQH